MLNSFTYDEYPTARPGGYGTGEAVRRGQVIINGFFDGRGFEDCKQDYQDHKDTTVLPYDFLPAGEDRGIHAGEIVFELLPTRNSGLQHALIRSVLNGIPVDKNLILRDDYTDLNAVPPEVKDRRIRQALTSRIVYRGLAQDNTPFSMDEETGTAVVVLGGKGTVNTSRKAIVAGDIIVATLPKHITSLKRVVPETSPLTPELLVDELFPENVMFMTEEMRKFMEMMFRISITTLLATWRAAAERLDRLPGGAGPANAHIAAFDAAVTALHNLCTDAAGLFHEDDFNAAIAQMNPAPPAGGGAPPPSVLDNARGAAISGGGNPALTGDWVRQFSNTLVKATTHDSHSQKFLMKGLVPCAGMLTTGLTAITMGVAQSGAPPMGKFEITMTAPTRNSTNDYINF